MRLKILDLMDEMGWVGTIRIDESQGFPDVIIMEFKGQETRDWELT